MLILYGTDEAIIAHSIPPEAAEWTGERFSA